MLEQFKRSLAPLLALSTPKKLVVAGIVVACALLFGIIMAVANKTDYRPLFSNLNSEDAGEITKKLKDQKVPFEIAADGKAVLVPADKVYELRLSLASEGLPQGGGVGFEIFDRKSFGMTEFVQKLNYQRALQGELARTIAQIAGVESARVHIAIPDKSLYAQAEKTPTASVVLKLRSNRALKDSDVSGISHLVASAIDGMSVDNVTIMDGRGKILNKGSASDPAMKKTSAMLETQANYEKNIEERLQSLLAPVVGSNKVVVRVNALFDFKQVERYEEKYDPESPVVRSEQKSEESSGASSVPSGVPGIPPNLNRTAPGAGAAPGQSRSDSTLNYEVSRSTARIIDPVGTLTKVSVAILVDGKYEKGATGAAGAAAAAKYTPRTPDELKKIDELVKGAVGYNATRGDQVTISNIPFQDTGEDSELSGAQKSEWYTQPIFLALAKNGAIVLAILAVILLVLRPLLKLVYNSVPASLDVLDQLRQQEEALAMAMKDRMAMSQLRGQTDVLEKIKGDPGQAAQILQTWLKTRE